MCSQFRLRVRSQLFKASKDLHLLACKLKGLDSAVMKKELMVFGRKYADLLYLVQDEEEKGGE